MTLPLSEVLLCMSLATAPVPGATCDDPFIQHYEDGLRQYASHKYEEAIDQFEAAYAIDPKPRLLFNVGESYRNLGKPVEALRSYRRCQTEEPNPPAGFKSDLAARIAQMKTLIEPPPPPRPLYKRTWLWGVVGGTVTVAVVALALGLTLNSGPSYDGPIRPLTF